MVLVVALFSLQPLKELNMLYRLGTSWHVQNWW